jgi:hypothetical protein
MTGYTPEIGEALCALVADGCGLKSASAKLGIARRSARRWEAEVPEFTRALAAARLEALENMAEELVELSDAVEKSGSMAEVQAQRLRIDTRRWVLSKLRPERYGDHLQLTGAGDQPLIPAVGSEAQIPRLLQVLSVILPDATNSQLFDLATNWARKLRPLEGPKGDAEAIGNGQEQEAD